MIKKQLGLLAGSVMLASTANAAITLGNDSLAVFNNVGGGSYYQLVSGSTADALVGGTGFSVDISAAATALGSIDSFALIGLATKSCDTGANLCYNYVEFTYVEEGGGLVFAGDSAQPQTNGDALVQLGAVTSFLLNADLGFNGEGSLGDADSNASFAAFLNTSATSSVIFNEQTVIQDINSQVIGYANGVGIVGSTLVASAVPVPAAAWLFGSALLGLGVLRRKG